MTKFLGPSIYVTFYCTCVFNFKSRVTYGLFFIFRRVPDYIMEFLSTCYLFTSVTITLFRWQRTMLVFWDMSVLVSVHLFCFEVGRPEKLK